MLRILIISEDGERLAEIVRQASACGNHLLMRNRVTANAAGQPGTPAQRRRPAGGRIHCRGSAYAAHRGPAPAVPACPAS